MKLSLNPKTYLEADSKELLLFCLRWTFGFWLLYVGLNKWIGGPEMFLGYIGKEFAETWVPPIMTTALGWIIITLEPILGALLMSGWRPRLVWLATAKLLFMLMLGKTILGDWNTVSNNWWYVAMCFAAASYEEPEKL